MENSRNPSIPWVGQQRRVNQPRKKIGSAHTERLSSIAQIALNLRDAALYYYYPSKQALAYAAHVYSLGRFERTLELSIASPGTGLERLRHLLLNFLEESDEVGQQLYFGERSYLNETQRREIDDWAGKVSVQVIDNSR